MDPIKSIAVPVTRRDAVAKSKRALRAEPAANPHVSGSVGEFRRQPQPATARPVHRYRVGQRLVMASGSREISRPAAICHVLALVPHEIGPLLYRVRSEAERFERVVDEIDLAPYR